MTPEIAKMFDDLEADMARKFDELHDALLARLDWMARSVGQRTRVVRVKAK
jgi:hypothetical protein